MPKQPLTDDEFIEQMTVGTLPADAQEGKAEEAFRALVEGGQGFLGLEPGRKGTEAYRTGQALSNLPMLAIPAAAVKAAPKVKGAVEDVATRAVRRIAENPDLSARDIYNAMLGKQAPGVPITTYHGSGNLFQQLDAGKAKSGVGEQRYGAGAGYTAQSRPVAESFIGAEAQALRASGGMDPKLEFVYDLVSQKRSDKDVLDMVAARYGDSVSFDEAADILQKAKAMTKGYLYKGDIPDEILPSFLDWNKSLKQQTPEVKKLLGKDPLVKESADPKRWNEVSGGIIQKGEGGLDDLTGDSIYKYISLKLGSDSAATEYLDKLGVRGIRYADPGSKGLGRAPSGTSNFVVFRPEDYRIESVNDMPVDISSPKAVRQVFEQAEKLPTNQFIDEVMSAHIGGVGDFGDESAKYYLSQVPGGPAYIKASQKLAKKNLGNQFMAYRLMPKDQFEALQSGDLGDLLSFSLSQSSAEALKKFVKNQKRDDLVVAEVPLTPEHVIAFGSPSEQEVIIDTGVGWSLDQFKQAAPLKKAQGGEVSNEDFIEQMTVGTRPTDQEPVPYDQTAAAQFADYLRAPVDLAQTAVRGTIGAVVGPAYGLYKGVTGGKYGTAEGVREASSEAGELMQKITGEPQSKAAKDFLQFINEKAEALKLAPMPQLMTAPLPGRGALRFQGEAAKGAVEDIALRAVRSQTENPDITAAQLYNAMLGKQAPGAAAVKPRGGIALTTPGSPLGNYIEDIIKAVNQDNYRTTVPENKRAEVADFIAKKMPKYISRDFGTENDPIRQAVLEGRINLFGRDKEKLRRYALTAARADDPEALEDVTMAYDRGTGLRPYLITPDTEDYRVTRDAKEKAVESLVQKMVAEGADENTARSILSERLEGISLKELEAAAMEDGNIRSNFGTPAQGLAAFGGKDQTDFIRRAVEQGDVAYGMARYNLLDMFDSEAVAKTIGAVPLEKLSRMSFPEAFIEGTNVLKLTRDFDVAVETARRGKGNTLPKEVLSFGTKPLSKSTSGNWVRITDPNAARLEGALMGHSVGGYGEDGNYNLGGKKALLSGKANLFSLRDEKGLPIVTVEMEDMGKREGGASDLKIRQVQGRYNSAPNEYMSDVFELAKEVNGRWPTGPAGVQRYMTDRTGKGLEEPVEIKWGDLYLQGQEPDKKAAGGEVTKFIRAHA